MVSSVEATNASTTRAQFSSIRDPDDEKNSRQLIGLSGAAGVRSRARPLEPPQQIRCIAAERPTAGSQSQRVGTANVQHPGPGFLEGFTPSQTPSKGYRYLLPALPKKLESFRIRITHNGYHRRHTAPGPARGRAQQGSGSPTPTAGRHWRHLGQAATPGQGETLCLGVLHNRVPPFL